MVTVPDTASPDEADGWVRRLIETRHRMFHDELRRRRERLRQLEGTASPYSDLIAADGPVRDASSEDVGGHLWIALTVSLPDDAREYDVATALNERLIDDPAQGHKISLHDGRSRSRTPGQARRGLTPGPTARPAQEDPERAREFRRLGALWTATA